MNRSRVVSELPIPDGFFIVSAQAAPYYDEARGVLHVWYGLGSLGKGEEGNRIFYANTSDLQIWSEPVVVIELPSDGIRDPTILVEGEHIYLFTQVYNSTTRGYHPIRLYRLSRAGGFWDPSRYEYLGVVVDLGDPGEFDDRWVASFCITKVDGVYYGVYEARSSNGTFSIGRTRTLKIDSLPYIKEGQLHDSSGKAIHNPVNSSDPIVPCTFAGPNLLFIHYDKHSGSGEEWQARYIAGDFTGGSLKISDEDLRPMDPYLQHNNIAHIGLINGRYAFLMQSGDCPEEFKLRLYMEPPESVSGWGEVSSISRPRTWLWASILLATALIILSMELKNYTPKW
ncbi:MAG: hypothetical protein QXH67_01340 [Candidatus Bathyarchaeia archaeon]